MVYVKSLLEDHNSAHGLEPEVLACIAFVENTSERVMQLSSQEDIEVIKLVLQTDNPKC